MSSDQSAAQVLYGNSTPAPVPAPAAPAQQPQAKSAAEALYGSKPSTEGMSDGDRQRAEQRAHDAREAQRAVDNTYGSATRTITEAAVERLGLSPDEAQASVRDWQPRFQSYGLSGDEAQSVVDVAVGAVAGNVDQSGWANQSRAALTREFGSADGAQRALDAARALVAKDPALAAFLDSSGLGSHPKVVVLLANKARSRR
jgi:hypothetical protein